MGIQRCAEHSPLPQEGCLVETEEKNLLKHSEISVLSWCIKGRQISKSTEERHNYIISSYGTFQKES